MGLLDIENVRDIRLATKGLMGIPQHFLQDEVKAAAERMASRANGAGVDIAVHTHVNAAQQVTPLVGRATKVFLDAGFRDVRNQGVLLRGVNTTPQQLLELCFMLLDHAKILPYYFYICDMIPNAEHWRTAVWEVQDLQHSIMGYLPGFATPRMVVDVPVRRQAVGSSGHRVRPGSRDLQLDEELPDRDRERGSGGVHAAVPLLRPDRHAPAGGPGVVAGAARRGVDELLAELQPQRA